MNTTSQERMTTNRANAQKSTGPKTAEGKAASKMNAVKHGILSREVLVSGEDQQELNTLQEWFEEDLQPVGPMEVMLVGQIVATHWRLRRILAAESSEIKREAELKEASANSSALPPPLEETSEGCRLLQSWLSDALLAVERDGELTLATVGEFSARVGHRPSMLKCNLTKLHVSQRLEQKGNGEEEEGPWMEAHKRAAVTFLQDNMSRLAERETRCQKREEKEAKARQTYAVLPSAEALEKLGRYESMLNRQLFRAMKELRTLQKERKESGAATKLPNEPTSPFSLTPALSHPTGEGERTNASENDLANSTNCAPDSLAHRMGESQGEGSSDLPNEPIPASEPSEISNLRSQMSGELPNEAMNEGVK